VTTAAVPVKVSGLIGGVVTNTVGVPQMGATVLLYNRQDRVCDKVLTDERGEFHFNGLFPDLYSVRVTLASFIPAVKKDILVQPGMLAHLSVNLNTLFSSIQIAYPPADSGTLMTDDWKWMLRSASSTRPILRLLDNPPLANDPNSTPHGSAFSETRGLVQLSAGDGPLMTGSANQADMGTAFALATSLFGNNQLELSGNLGYGAQTGVPVAAFRTAYSRAGNSGPEVSVTMRQLFLPERGGSAMDGGGLPMLRSVSASVDDHTELTDEATLQYGFTMDSVSFGDRLNYFSPYARLLYALDENSEVSLAYTAGNARPDLATASAEDSDLQRDISTIGLFPRISLLNGTPKIQRGTEFELAYSRRMGSRSVELSGYRGSVSNAALSVAGLSNLGGSDFLPDLFTGNSIFNAGDYNTIGFTAALTQNLGSNVSATVMYGSNPGLSVSDDQVISGSPDELRSRIRAGRRQAVTARVAVNSPRTGTHLIASYQWLADNNWITLGNTYSTQAVRPVPGLNVYIRQPIPGLSMLPWRIEATVDLRNLLAEGYLPMNLANGQQLLLVQTPRSFRGGFSFIF
jgi:hypothetical protein